MKAWILSDGAAGNLRQAETLAQWLGLQAQRIDLSVGAPWRWLAPWALRAPRQALAPPLAPPWPEVAIGCGRRGAIALDALPAAAAGGPWRIQILDPRCPPQRFEAVIVPEHDALHGANVVSLCGSLHPVDAHWLQARRPAALDCPAPRSLLLVGGHRRGIAFGSRELTEMLRILEHWQARDEGCLWIALSRRTPAGWRQCIERFLPRLGSHRLWRDAGDGANPYELWLANADRILVTPDSVNMLSEACATGVPVLTHAPRGLRGRLGEFHRELRERGHLRPLKLNWQPWDCPALQQREQVLAQLRRLPGYPLPDARGEG